ncbi:MAG: tetratricopeptide repeat protein [Candidatus Cloacimonadales bacterium]
MKRIIIIGILLLANLAWANSDRDILTNQARRLQAGRQYERVITLYREWLQEHPQDWDIAGKLIESYLQADKTEQAQQLLRDYLQRFPNEAKVKYQVLINLKKAEYDLALQQASKFLESVDESAKFLEISRVFQANRQYDAVAQILLQARQAANNPQLFARELATNYFYQKKYEASIREYFVMLEEEERYHYFAASRIRNMLQEDAELIKEVKQAAAGSSSEKAPEILADAYAEVGEYELALQEYEYLPINSLLRYAKKLVAAENFEVGKTAYLKYIERNNNQVQQADARIELAKIEIKLNNLAAAQKYLSQVYNDEKISSGRYARRSKANSAARELLSELALRQEQDVSQAIKYLEEAAQFAANSRVKQEINLQRIELILMSGDFEQTQAELQKIFQASAQITSGNQQAVRLDFLVNLMQASAAADSLLGEVMIQLPGDAQTNDALQLYSLSQAMNETEQQLFFAAYRNRSIYNVMQAVQNLEELFAINGNEALLILAGEWHEQIGNISDAKRYFQQEYTSEDLQQYALLRWSEISADQNKIANFLQKNSSSIFAAKFRNLYNKE